MEPSSLIWPKQVTWDLRYAYSLPTSELLTFESGSSSLLPTPAANQSGRTPEQHVAMKRGMPGGTRKAITDLGVLAKAGFDPLLPTPGANDSTGAEKETREQRQKDGRTGTASLRDLPRLLPTPTESDADSAGSRNLPGSKAHSGTSLTDAMVRGGASTDQPSSAGSASSDAELPIQLTIEDA